jgi:Zn-dependent peptidase ImmA (M78 family)
MNEGNLSFFGVRLKLARKMAGMSLQALSDNLGNLVSKQALNKYEQGLMNPSNEVLLAISKLLNLKPDFFLKKEYVEINNISFRKRATLSKKLEESIIEKARDYVERYFEIENILGIQSVFINPVDDIIIRNRKDSEQAAVRLRQEWELGSNPISNLVELLELKGIKIFLIDEIDQIDGISFVTHNNIPVIVVNTREKSIERIRFTIIHELAHILLSIDKNITGNRKDVEILCHYFSSCFLIPTTKLIDMIGGSHRSYINIKELIDIKAYYGISIRAIVHRLEHLKVITYSYYQRWMIYMSKTYGQKNEPGEYSGVEKSTVFERLVNRALAEELISQSKAASLLNTSINEIRKGVGGVS